jgi:hypothetical protein
MALWCWSGVEEEYLLCWTAFRSLEFGVFLWQIIIYLHLIHPSIGRLIPPVSEFMTDSKTTYK